MFPTKSPSGHAVLCPHILVTGGIVSKNNHPHYLFPSLLHSSTRTVQISAEWLHITSVKVFTVTRSNVEKKNGRVILLVSRI